MPPTMSRFRGSSVAMRIYMSMYGVVFRTQRGEMSVRVVDVTLLSKSLLPLPEKFHGLTSTELRYRQRYVAEGHLAHPPLGHQPPGNRHLFALQGVEVLFDARGVAVRHVPGDGESQFIKHVRDFMDGRGFMEVETPVLNTISGGATARPFVTRRWTWRRPPPPRPRKWP